METSKYLTVGTVRNTWSCKLFLHFESDVQLLVKRISVIVLQYGNLHISLKNISGKETVATSLLTYFHYSKIILTPKNEVTKVSQ